MTNEEILEKAIDKALRNGLRLSFIRIGGKLRGIDVVLNCSFPELMGIIFTHDFAKAFWGECKRWLDVQDGEGIDDVNEKEYKEISEEIKNENQGYWRRLREIDGWQYHLQQMVLEKEPLKYLKKFL